MSESVRKGVLGRGVALSVIAVAIPAVAAGVGLPGGREIWINFYWLAAAFAALFVSLIGVRELSGGQWRYRIAISAALGLYATGQVVWFAQVTFGQARVPGPSDLFFLSCALLMSWAVVRVVQRRVSRETELIVVLDALTVSAALVVIAVTVLGPELAPLPRAEATFLLLYPILFLAPAGAALVSALALPTRLEWRGIWVLVTAWLLLGVSFSIWTLRELLGGPSASPMVDYLFGVGLILSGYGAATWPNERSTGAVETRWLQALSHALPVLAMSIAVLVALAVPKSSASGYLIWGGIVGLFALTAVRQTLLLRSLRRGRERLRAMAAELSAAESRERREIATYLHDKVIQSLALLAMRFKQLHGESDADRIKRLERDIQELLRQTVDDTRSATFDLSPPILHTIGLEAALEWIGESLCDRYEIEFVFSDDEQHKSLEHDEASLMYRFARELIMNAIKHARARRIALRVARLGTLVVVTVEDDGIGFDVDLVTGSAGLGGFGLYSIRERVASLGGELQIESSPDAGTSARVSVPLRPRVAPTASEVIAERAARGS